VRGWWRRAALASVERLERPGPWWRAAMALPSALYGGASRLRIAARARDAVVLPVPVVSVGALSVGGSGKTPAARLVAELLRARGIVAGVVGNGRAPDEERLLRAWLGEGAIVGAGRVREEAGRAAIAAGARVLVLDDGYQYTRLRRALDIVCVDARDPLEGGRVLPAGRLREPAAGLARAHLLWTAIDAEAGTGDAGAGGAGAGAGDPAAGDPAAGNAGAGADDPGAGDPGAGNAGAGADDPGAGDPGATAGTGDERAAAAGATAAEAVAARVAAAARGAGWRGGAADVVVALAEPVRPAALAAGAPVLVCTGVARPERVAAAARAAGLDVRGLHALPDHADLDAAEELALRARARAAGAALLVTEKDAARLRLGALARGGGAHVLLQEVRLVHGEARLQQALDAVAALARGGRP